MIRQWSDECAWLNLCNSSCEGVVRRAMRSTITSGLFQLLIRLWTDTTGTAQIVRCITGLKNKSRILSNLLTACWYNSACSCGISRKIRVSGWRVQCPANISHSPDSRVSQHFASLAKNLQEKVETWISQQIGNNERSKLLRPSMHVCCAQWAIKLPPDWPLELSILSFARAAQFELTARTHVQHLNSEWRVT